MAVPLATNHEYLQTVHTQVIRRSPDGGSIEILRMIPPELELDALAARSRPLFLERDRCGFDKGLSALKRLVRDSGEPNTQEYLKAIADLVDGWKRVRDQESSRYEVIQQDAAEGAPVRSWQQTELASAWQYGDLVHADQEHADAADRVTRMLAGWEVQAQICALAHTSIAFIRGFDDELSLGIPTSAYEASDLPSGMATVSETDSLLTWVMDAEQDGPDLRQVMRDSLPDPREDPGVPDGATALDLAPGQAVRVEVQDPVDNQPATRWSPLLKGGAFTVPPLPWRARLGLSVGLSLQQRRWLAEAIRGASDPQRLWSSRPGPVRVVMSFDTHHVPRRCHRLSPFVPYLGVSRVRNVRSGRLHGR